MLIETIILLVVGRRIAKICQKKGHEPKPYVIWTGVLCIGGGLLGLGLAYLLFGFGHGGHGLRITLTTGAGLLIGVALSFWMAHRLEDLTNKDDDGDPMSPTERGLKEALKPNQKQTLHTNQLKL